MSQELTIVKQENISTIVSAAPKLFQDNRMSCQRCVSAGEALLKAISDTGMTDELDQQAAIFVEKARKTVKKMNERRSPVTKLFDDIRREFTALENVIDPAKSDTIPYKLQILRNRYAAKKRAEEEERRRNEIARQQAEQVRRQLIQDIEVDFNVQFNNLLNGAINYLIELDNSLTLDNYQEVSEKIKNHSVQLPVDWLLNLHTVIRFPAGITAEEVRKAETDIKERLKKKFEDMYTSEVQDNKNYIIDRMFSKKNNLERIAKANVDEASRIKAEMEEHQRKEASLREEERQRKEAEEKAKAEMERKNNELEGLFSAQAVQGGYQPKAKGSQKINLLKPEGIIAIFSMWWSKEGNTLSVEKLCKIFRRQITFCEKLANKEDTYIEDESVEYVDNVKAI